MKEILLACVCGMVVGILFRLTKLPMPAPNALAGIIGILGIYLGYKIIDIVKDYSWFKP
jgi:XapX domain-containing protein